MMRRPRGPLVVAVFFVVLAIGTPITVAGQGTSARGVGAASRTADYDIVVRLGRKATSVQKFAAASTPSGGILRRKSKSRSK